MLLRKPTGLIARVSLIRALSLARRSVLFSFTETNKQDIVQAWSGRFVVVL